MWIRRAPAQSAIHPATMKTVFSTAQNRIQGIVLLLLGSFLTCCNVSGLQLGADPIDDAILLGLDGVRDYAPMVKKSDPQVYGMWFGPRLGRRERRSADEILDDAGDSRVEEVLQLLKETPWALVPLKGSKRQAGAFIPRLGRESNEDEDPDVMEQRSPPFAPRLGRRLVPFRPRMGRDRLPHDVYSPRLGRSVQPPQSQGKKQALRH